MDNFTYYIITPTLTATQNTAAAFPQQVFQGPVNVTLAFDNITELIYPALKVNIDWGDGTAPFLHSGSIDPGISNLSLGLKPISHTYYPSTSTYFTNLSAQVQIVYANFTSYYALIPIQIAQTSFFHQYGTLSLVDAQFTDTPTNDIFAILQSEIGDIYNVVFQLS